MASAGPRPRRLQKTNPTTELDSSPSMVPQPSQLPSVPSTSSPSSQPSKLPSIAPSSASKSGSSTSSSVTTESPTQTAVWSSEGGDDLVSAFVGGAFCRQASLGDAKTTPDSCKQSDNTWDEIVGQNKPTFYQREFSGVCGPHCRPSCVTLMLDLDKLRHDDLICDEKRMCQCQFTKRDECRNRNLDALYHRFPKCYLEETDCLGPTVYDDVVAYTEKLSTRAGLALPKMDHCASILSEDRLCRFKDWKVVTPTEDFTCADDCISSKSKIYFEYCNVVEEDPTCDQCKGKNCGAKCKKIVEPLPSGWTSFVVSASIPYYSGYNTGCDKSLQYEDETRQACFLQRVELYYPPGDERGSADCPHCHDCPLLGLGDTFGPLEVVGFGNCLESDDQICSPCDERAEKLCGACQKDCDDLFGCHDSVDCFTGESLGLPIFMENQCSYRDFSAIPESDEFWDKEKVNETGDENGDNNGLVPTGSIQNEEKCDSSSEKFDARSILLTLVVELAVALIVTGAMYIRKRRLRRRARKLEEDEQSTSSKKTETSDPRPVPDQDGFREYQSASIIESPGRESIEAVHTIGSSRLP